MRLIYLVTLIFFLNISFCQEKNFYKIYAIEFARLNYRTPATSIAVGAKPEDTVDTSFFIFLLIGNNNKKILVDAGYTRACAQPMEYFQQYIRPDSALLPLNIRPEEITDIIITHPHWDHINGIMLFPKASLWMQKKDYEYFIDSAWHEGGNNIALDIKDAMMVKEKYSNNTLFLVDGDSIEIISGITVLTGSRHTYESQHVLVNTKDEAGNPENVIIASDDCWYYYNLEHLLPITLLFDPDAYVKELKRMKMLVKDPNLVIPGHDRLVLSKFPQIAPGIVRIR